MYIHDHNLVVSLVSFVVDLDALTMYAPLFFSSVDQCGRDRGWRTLVA